MPGFLAEALTWSDNHHILAAVEVAYELHMPPLDFLRPTREDEGTWSGLDKKLVYAYKIMQNETCGYCKQPVWICRNDDSNIDFSIRVGTCHSKATMDKDEERRSKSKSGKLKNGQYLYSIPMQVNGKPIPRGTRKSYYESLSED